MNAGAESTRVDEAQIRRLVQEAERAHAARQPERAAALLFEAQRHSPEHPLVLNAAGLQALDSGQFGAAEQLFRRAIAKDGGNPAFFVNLATTLRRQNRLDEELEALDAALVAHPRHLFALLQKAALLGLRGRPRESALTYSYALATVTDEHAMPPAMRTAIEHARRVVRENNDALDAFMRPQLDDARAGGVDTETGRFDHGLQTFLGRSRIYTAQPTLFALPGLPAIEFFARDHFPWLALVEEATAAIREEFERVLIEDQDRIEAYINYRDGVPLDQWTELNRSRRWSAFFLHRNGAPVVEALERCPRTAEVLRRVPLHDVPGHAPTAFFSILDARTHIPPHTGVTNTRAIVHVPLVVPPTCRFRVGSQTRAWRPGEAWVFDDTIEHEAWNDSDAPRGILIFDVWNPLLSERERELVRRLMSGIKEYYGPHAALENGI